MEVKYMSYAWPLFTFGNGDIIFAVLNSLQALMNSPLFAQLLNLVFLIGFALIVFSGVVRGGLSLVYTVKYMLLTALFIRLLSSFTITVGLIDHAHPSNNKIINKVPFILGIPASFLSQIGQYVALAVDTFYSTPLQRSQKHPLSHQGYNQMGILINQSLGYHFSQPWLKKSLSHFFVDCVSPLISEGVMPLSTLSNSHSIWTLVKSSPYYMARMTVYYDDEKAGRQPLAGRVVTCHEAAGQIDRDLRLYKAPQPLLATRLQAVLHDIDSQSQSQASQSAHMYLRQSAMLNMLMSAVPREVNARTSSLALVQPSHPHQPAFYPLHSFNLPRLFQSVLGYMYAVLQVIVYAIVPFVVVFSLLPGLRGLLIKRYVQLLAWYPVTLVLMTLVNNILLTWSVGLLSPIWQSAGGLTLNNREIFFQTSVKLIEVGSWLESLVPLIAWRLVSGLSGVIAQVGYSSLFSHSSTPVSSLDSDAHTQTGLIEPVTDTVAMPTSYPAKSSLAGAASTLPDHAIAQASQAMQRHGSYVNQGGHSAVLSSEAVAAPSRHIAHAAQTQLQARQAELAGDIEKADDLHAQSDSYISQAFHSLSDHLGGGVQGNVLAGSLVGAGLIAAGSGLIAALPEEALLAVGGGVAHAAELEMTGLGEQVASIFSGGLETVQGLVGDHFIDLSSDLLEAAEDIWGIYAHNKNTS